MNTRAVLLLAFLPWWASAQIAPPGGSTTPAGHEDNKITNGDNEVSVGATDIELTAAGDTLVQAASGGDGQIKVVGVSGQTEPQGVFENFNGQKATINHNGSRTYIGTSNGDIRFTIGSSTWALLSSSLTCEASSCGALFYATPSLTTPALGWDFTKPGSGLGGSGTTGSLAVNYASVLQFENDGTDQYIRLPDSKTPASASDSCTAGEFVWDASYFYICTATDTWRRAAHSSW